MHLWKQERVWPAILTLHASIVPNLFSAVSSVKEIIAKTDKQYPSVTSESTKYDSLKL